MAAVKFFIWYFFDWRGRIGRLSFFAGYFGSAIIAVALERAARPWPILVFLVFSAGLLVNLSLEAKRWHDMGRSALWILWTSLGIGFWFGFTMIAMVPWSSLAHPVRGAANGAAGASIIASLGYWLLAGVVLPLLLKMGWLAFGRGAAGFNEYDFPERPSLFGGAADERQHDRSESPPRIPSSQSSGVRSTFGRRGL